MARVLQEAFIAACGGLSRAYGQLHEDEIANEMALKAKSLRDEKSFRLNLSKRISIIRFEIEKLIFFKNIDWRIQPKMNILLGKNGYGKTYLLRFLLCMLQKNSDKIGEFFQDSGKRAFARCHVTRDGEKKTIFRVKSLFEESIGKAPVLAIPDVRFIDKSRDIVTDVSPEETDLARFGAHNFIFEKKDEHRVHGLIYRLCISYLNNDKSFNSEIFDVLKNVIHELTGQHFEFSHVDVINDNTFKLFVTADSDAPIAFQKISQGTLSILTIFGLIYYYLKSIFPDSKRIANEHGIVFIDEIDAHLHPSWQQKVVPLLRRTFPNIQFFLTAHSPLVAAGCLEKEVTILRRNEKGSYSLFQFENDFIGWTTEELYKKVFEIEDRDETYLYYSALPPFRGEIEAEIKELENEEHRSSNEEKKLQRLHNELYYLQKVQGRRDKRKEYDELLRSNRNLKLRLRKLTVDAK